MSQLRAEQPRPALHIPARCTRRALAAQQPPRLSALAHSGVSTDELIADAEAAPEGNPAEPAQGAPSAKPATSQPVRFGILTCF